MAQVAERERVLGGGAEGDVIVMKALRKVYGPKSYSKVAVKGVSLGIAKGECFGYLGINGAGKTSTLAMLTGDVLPSSYAPISPIGTVPPGRGKGGF